MRLKHIKLVGFKSFVDPTKVPFPHQMTCVVGPNGCGKSNVIDAVRWVLGESSAKNLRGDAMTDVIFNGSNARKPVSQASVELVFDNTSGRIQGEYASYAEISVKRLVTRDGRSDYFLNSSKCRRRDITDLFLGTGLGPRSYAIIEQGMISRLIESKPQELRVFIEEAAGISKYKERRKETESRIQHTRDNLDRLTDVRDELGAQLDKLQRQAAAARRYKELKAQERTYRAELQALRWLAIENQAESIRRQIQSDETELEKWLAEQRGSERGTTELREQTADAKQRLDAVQQQFYQLGNDVTRTEHQLQSLRGQLQQREQRKRELSDELERLDETYQRDVEAEVQLQLTIDELTPQHEESQAKLEQAQVEFEALEARYEAQQDAHQQFLEQQQRRRETEQNLKLQIERAEHQQARCLEAIAQLKQELEASQRELNALDTAELQEQLSRLEASLHERQQQLGAVQTEKRQAQEHSDNLQTAIAERHTEQQQLGGRQSSLQTLLEAASASHWPESVKAWLDTQQVTARGQVRDHMQVTEAWQLAIEQLTGAWLDAWIVDERLQQWPEELGARVVVLGTESAPRRGSLAAECQGLLTRWEWLQNIAAASSTDAAQQCLADGWLAAMTPSGQFWSAAGYSAASIEAADSQLLQQQELTSIEARLHAISSELKQLQDQRQQQQSLLEQIDQQLQAERDAMNELQAQRATWQDKLLWQQEQQQRIQSKIAQWHERIEAQQQEAEEAALTAAVASEELAQYLEQDQAMQDDADWQQQRQVLQQQRQELRDRLQQRQQQAQQVAMQLQQAQMQLQQMATLLERSKQHSAQTQEQLQLLQEPASEQQEELEMLALQLEELLQQREAVDEQRRDIANEVSTLEQQLREVSSGAQGVEAHIEKARQKVQSSQLELVALQERSRNVLAVLQEMNQPIKPILEQLSDEANEKQWQAEVERLQAAIQRLGAINLAAIDEAETLAERKSYLDQQHDDLSSSLETLETAIRKINKETRQRFRTTFDSVNAGLQELFPKVFGGGTAYLALTDDDLLETGVTIMARPPGKKNSTIHLLSGGEKALTALSLVFAIFRLNPAPFCLLDEVDAPLDDANVGRFCRLVEEMSETVQFIYISHNKIAMEMASHLAGVTMQEPGVSRLVAVDIEAAVAMTEA
ncbi:chromosome segregation protein SMC [Pseudidiomarina aestuarii]|uniref:Chromosome partition protein Smc n=1 Tax=Pseudidiomarina aestuarii TaxID=624146 RepID=A0A7Z6ZT32_9GAMM|nr:chromosome segregation protein SMC [Pseudidiomarina aestuarii]RUO40756.1 chromosome segregation protein SMC [Pseudidiomarina aestuarii]